MSFAFLEKCMKWSVSPCEQVLVFAVGEGNFVVVIREELNGEDSEGFEHVVEIFRGRDKVIGTFEVPVCPEATGIYAEVYRPGRFGLERVWKMERTSPPRLKIAREEALVV